MTLKIAKILAASMLLLALLKMPSGYYTILRIFITIVSILCVIHFWNKQAILSVFFLVIAVIFNPVIPIYLYDRSLWAPIDIVAAIIFLVAAFYEKNNITDK